jgi:predicted membrane protein
MRPKFILGIILIVWGISSLLGIRWLWGVLWPMILIVMGINILFSGDDREESVKTKKEKDGGDSIDERVFFGSLEKKYETSTFEGGKVICVFGGGEFDISEVGFEGEVEVEVVCIFGGVKLIVPKDVAIKTNIVGIIGGVTNETKPKGSDKTLRITGVAMFGGVEIEN